MLRKPLVSFVFDAVEASRAAPNSKTPFDDEIMIVRDVPFKSVGDEILRADIYLPPGKAEGLRPVVMDIPGGGWMIRNRKRREGYARLFAVMGAVVFVIEHRLCPSVYFPENLIDCVDALNFIGSLDMEYGLDVNNVTVTGDSSGGHLAACLGCAASSREYCEKLGLPAMSVKPSACIFVSGSFSMEIMYRIPLSHTCIVRYCTGCETRREFREWKYYKEIDPYNYINPDFPISFNVGGTTDVLCPGEAKRMADALTRAGVKNRVVVGANLFNSGHCHCLRLPFAPARKDLVKLFAWYRNLQAERGVAMDRGFERVSAFLNDYRSSLQSKI